MTTTEYIIELSGTPASDFGKKEFADHSDDQKIFTAVFGSSGSIFMDGFELYFVNYDGEAAYFAPEAYRRIGAPKSAEIIEKASRVVSSDPIPESSDARATLVSGLTEEGRLKLEELGQLFYSTGEIIDDLLFDFVKAHPDTFGPVPGNIERQADRLSD
jgi:hypothetical protein